MSLFYIKDKRRNIVPVDDFELDKKAKEILEDIRKNHFDNIPKYYKDNWDKVKLYSPSWDIEKANAILINPEEWAYDLWNKLNDLQHDWWLNDNNSKRKISNKIKTRFSHMRMKMFCVRFKYFHARSHRIPFRNVWACWVAKSICWHCE